MSEKCKSKQLKNNSFTLWQTACKGCTEQNSLNQWKIHKAIIYRVPKFRLHFNMAQMCAAVKKETAFFNYQWSKTTAFQLFENVHIEVNLLPSLVMTSAYHNQWPSFWCEIACSSASCSAPFGSYSRLTREKKCNVGLLRRGKKSSSRPRRLNTEWLLH